MKPAQAVAKLPVAPTQPLSSTTTRIERQLSAPNADASPVKTFRANCAAPGNKVVWQGMARLTDIAQSSLSSSSASNVRIIRSFPGRLRCCDLWGYRALHLVVNNARILIMPWIRCKNLASRILALVSRRLPDDRQHLGKTQGRGIAFEWVRILEKSFAIVCRPTFRFPRVDTNHRLTQ